jgi:hypothetical protein
MHIFGVTEALWQTQVLNASHDSSAKAKAKRLFARLANETGAPKLIRFVLYDGERLVCDLREGAG